MYGSQGELPGEDGVRKLGGHSLIYAVSSFVGQLGALLTFPLYTRSLGVEAYGVLALALAAAGVLRTLVIAGTNTALLHERISTEPEETSRVTGAAFLYVAAASVVLGLVTLLLGGRIEALRSMGGGLLGALVAYIAVDSLFELVLAAARAESRPTDYAFSNAIRVGATFVVAALLLVGLGIGPVGAVVGMLVGSTTAGVWLAIRLSLRPRFSGALVWVPRLLREGGPLLPANLASWVMNLADRYMLLFLLGSTATVGLYSAGYRVGGLITILFVGPFHTAFLPLMLRRNVALQADATYQESSRLFLSYGSIAVLLLQAVAWPAVRVLAGAQYAGAERVVGPVAFGCLLSGVAMLMTPSALKSGRAVYLAIAYGSGALLNVLLNVILIPATGMLGAAAATLIGYGVVAVTMLWLMPSELRPPGMIGALWRAIPVMALATIPSMVSYGSEALQTIVTVGLSLTGVGALWMAGVFRRADARLAYASLASLLRTSVSRLVPRTGRIGPGIRRVLWAVEHMPSAVLRVTEAHWRRWKRRSSTVGGACGWSSYRDYLDRSPDASERVLSGVDRLLDNEMMTFTFPWEWRSGQDWHLDPISGRRWKRIPSAALDVNSVVNDSDVQCVWETSRLEHLWRAAYAYSRTRDRKYAEWVVAMLQSWRQHNPVGWGVNWTVSMEVAMRAIAIAEIRSAVCDSDSWSDATEHSVCEMLADHVEWVLDNLEDRGRYTQNHYLAALVGVISVASFLPDWEYLQREVRWVYPALFECIQDQVLIDGVSFENSVGYHLLVCELVGYSLGICRTMGVEVPDAVHERLSRMIDFAHTMEFKDGTSVAFGDDDDDFILPSASGHFDVLRPSVDARIGYGSWLIDQNPKRSQGVADPPLAYQEAGVYVLGSKNLRVFVNAMATGVCGTGPHRHNDALSFCLEIQGNPVLIDPGTFRYQSSSDSRNRYRSVVAHNTVQIDGAEQNDLESPFALREDRIDLSETHVSLSGERQRLEATHAGFVKDTGVYHRRVWEFLAGEDRLCVTDMFRDDGASDRLHTFVSRFHLAPGLVPGSPTPVGPDTFRVRCGMCLTDIEVTDAQDVSVVVTASHYSPRYRVEVPSWVLEVRWTGTVDSTIITSFSASKASAP